MTASAWWIDGPLIWLLAITLFTLLLCTNAARQERAERKREAQRPVARIIPIHRRERDHRHDR